MHRSAGAMSWKIVTCLLLGLAKLGSGTDESPQYEQRRLPEESPGLTPSPPGEDLPAGTVIAGLVPDRVEEMYNLLDGDSFGIGPMHEFVYGWQSIVNTMSMKNNVEVRKRAGLQRFALAGINGVTLVSHIGATEIMINGTRSYCFGGVSRPPGHRSVICKGAMYQEGRFSCKVPYLRYPTMLGYYYCLDDFAVIKSLDGSYKKASCVRGHPVPKFHYDYICERRELKIRRLNLSDVNEKYNIRNPVVRRVEYYRSPNDILKQCPDWYGCNLQISIDTNEQDTNAGLLQANETAFVGHGGKYWLALYYSKVRLICSFGYIVALESDMLQLYTFSEGIWDQLLKANIGPDMNLHYNLNGIYNRFPSAALPPDIVRNDGQVQPANMRQDQHEVPEEIGPVGGTGREGFDLSPMDSFHFLHDSQVQPSFQGHMNQ